MDYVDRRTDPAQDFYRFACGRWLDANPVPADKTRWSGFDELRERNFELLRDLLEDAQRTARSSSTSPRSQIGRFYAAAMDRPLREKLGTRPILEDLKRIQSARSVGALLPLLARFHRDGIGGLFYTGVDLDEKNSGVYALYVMQGGLSLPDRDYYLLPRFAAIRDAYRQHVRKVFLLIGDPPAQAERAARAVLKVETAIAKASRSRVELRDAEKNYNRFPLKELLRRHPRLRWAEYFRTRGLKPVPYLVVGQPEFFDALHALVKRVALPEWKAYLRWHVVHDAAPLLHSALEEEDFDFFHRQLLGREKPEPDWKRAAALVDAALGEALGQLYVQRHFPPESKARMMDLVQDIKEVFRARLETIPWMTDATRAMALKKFDRFGTKIGYPRTFRDYSRIRVEHDDPVGNVRRARAFEIQRNIARVAKPADREEWEMTPPTVNAYYKPTLNEIVFPAGILQPPFFDPSMDDAVNFGGIAVVIGHEITHGYDDQGRKYDADGNLKEWWTAEDAQEFQNRARRIVEQYGRFEPLPGMTVNGELTMGENIADLGGVSIAFEALQRRIASGRTKDERIDEFTPEQRFFLSYGQIWRGNTREAEERRRLTIDPHSPGHYRVNGALANVPDFWKAFSIPAGAPMRQDESRRVSIW